ncbi:MAG: homoserine dehydrogenase [Pseudomonadales bacterium]|nr:homoserine dehydrogenase [Pseudomonadales bacterium]
MKAINIGICGLGTVGAGVVNVMQRNVASIAARAGREVLITHIGARRDNPACDLGSTKISRDIFAVVNDPDVDIVVELIGGYEPALELVMQAIANGKHVVTANKALIAMHGNEIFAAADARGVSVLFEAAVAGGIPIIKAIREGLAANSIEWLAGIINGTGNYILTEMRDKGRQFDDVLVDAQQLGYAEADPTFDVEGIDAAHKLVILASLAFGMPLNFEACFTEGISAIAPQDVIFAGELGYRIKHLGIARKVEQGVEMRVHPTLIPQRRLIANVDGVMNAVLVKGDAVGPTLYYGAGAGAEPTASSVIADIVDVVRGIDAEPINRVPALGVAQQALSTLPALSISDINTAYYLRINVSDQPGVLSHVTQILSDAGISIEAVLQKEVVQQGVQSEQASRQVPIVLITSQTLESQFMAAVKNIEALDVVQESVHFIRVESLG